MLQRIDWPRARQWLYGVATAVLALAVGYDWIAPDKLPLWLGLVAALFVISATSTAAVAVRKQRKDGTLDGQTPGKHEANP